MLTTEIKSTTVSAADARAWGFSTLASIDNPKASKATDFGFLNAILYMAPSDVAGVGDLCVYAGACKALCLGMHSGQAQIRKEDEDNATTRARKARAVAFMKERPKFMDYIVKDIERLERMAADTGAIACYRFNGSTDVGLPLAIMLRFPRVVFIDYTKNPRKMAAYLAGKFPSNYHVTFSYDCGTTTVPSNAEQAAAFIQQGGNVAIVGDVNSVENETLRNAPRMNGDLHDIRIPQLDGRGVVVVLTPKGRKAQNDQSGFVVRKAA